MCLYPTLHKNPRYTKNKKNGGVIPPVSDKRLLVVPIGCKKCVECREQRAREWQIRLMEEVKHNRGRGTFVTLTFNNEAIKKLVTKIEIQTRDKMVKAGNDPFGKIQLPVGYDMDNAIATIGTRYFLENWRKKTGESVRHWLTTELGHNGTENIHLHGIIWSKYRAEMIRDRWQHGYVWPRSENEAKWNYVNERTVNYITKYVSKMDFDHPNYIPKILSTPGIGNEYTAGAQARLQQRTKEDTYKTNSGHKIGLPIYYRNKLFTEKEREQMWLEKLDKQERYVRGVKIDVSKDYDLYWKMVEDARKENDRMGYGSNIMNWEQIEYEKQRREYLLEKRINGREGEWIWEEK